MKKSVIGSAVVFGLAVAIAAPSMGGCGSSSQGNSASGSGGSQGPSRGAFGTVAAELSLPGGETITSVSWSINQGATVVLTGTYAVPPAATTISFFIPNVPTGSGYTITLSATSPDGTVGCVGTSAPFSVASQQTTSVNVFLTCTTSVGTDAGGVQVNGSTEACATWTSASATPSSQVPGGVITLGAGAVAPNTTGITYLWTAPAGTIATSNAADTTFTCPAVAQSVTITLLVGDGATLPDGGAYTCPAATSSTTLTVVCGNPPCFGIGSGVEATPDTAAGTCPTGQTNTGTLKDSSNNFCCSATPCYGVGTGVEATPDTAAGTCPTGQTNTLKDTNGNFCCAPPAALAPCTTTGQTNCVSCQGSTGGLCSPTEAALVQHDITKGLATAAGNDPTAGCYTCLYNAGALDDITFNDTGHECGNLPTASQAACSTTLSCILAASCAYAGTYPADAGITANSVSDCYCGTAPTSGTCTSGGANGGCDAQEAAGLGFAETDGLDILKNFTSTTLASGVANNIFQGAISNSCTQCLH